MQITEIKTDDTLRELRRHGRPDFPFEYYYDDIKGFDKQYVEWHWHNEFEFITVDTGPVDCSIGNERIRLAAGEGMFINSGVFHKFESPLRGTAPNILFAPDFFASKDSAVYRNYIAPVLLSGCCFIAFQQRSVWETQILEQLNRIYQTAQSSDRLKELRIQALVCELWRLFYETAHDHFSTVKTSQNTLLQSRLQLMIQFIGNNYKEKIKLDDIAHAANISKSEALRCFHTGVQTTPVCYLIAHRLNRARELLLTTDDTIANISAEVGFDSGSYFTHTFTKTFGITPKAFRNRR
ncbi:MAG: AraC family transcriptional regulator [Oscillospiraceae bacterium]|jgi:AraC-like DNA-binding protein